MQLEEIQQSIELRRNRIFLLMEEVRRLRIQQRVKVSSTYLCIVCSHSKPFGWQACCILQVQLEIIIHCFALKIIAMLADLEDTGALCHLLLAESQAKVKENA